MRGNKFGFKIFVLIAILCVGIASNFLYIGRAIEPANAEDNGIYKTNYCSQKYDDNIIFSAEQVYYVQGESETNLRDNGLSYNSSGYSEENDQNLTNIIDENGKNNYFANYGGGVANINKKIIYSGDFVMLDDNAKMTAYDKDKNAVVLKQGVVLTLGGYIFSNGNLITNSQATANITHIRINMTKDGESVENLVPRTIDGINFDWVYFIDANVENEAHYVLDIEYMYNGKISNHSFDFYILINSVYTKTEEINGYNYSANPTIEYATYNNTLKKYEAKIYNENQPTLTYDYMHYDLNYTYVVNDLVTSVEVAYNQTNKQIIVKSSTNNNISYAYYDCVDGNSYLTFVFSNIGNYTFNFNYVHYDGDNRIVVDNLSVDSMKLNISGYELKYAKTGYYSSSFRKINIIKNGTMVIADGGYKNVDATNTDNSESLGYMYEFVEKDGKSGTIDSSETADITNDITNGTVTISSEEGNEGNINLSGLPTNIINTDQPGVWLSLNDKYVAGYYLYSTGAFNEDSYYPKNPVNKETTFTDTGYYFVVANSKYEEKENTQYFLFRISSPMANVKLYTTTDDAVPADFDSLDRIYSNQYTNKKVFATWNDPTTFESNQKVSIYNSLNETNCYQSKESLMAFANGGANSALVKTEYKKETLLTRKGSYLLEMSIVGSQTKAYYYFTIDTDDISNVDILAVSKAYLGTSAIYAVARDDSGNAISYASKTSVNQPFTIWWDDKPSGATVKATYSYTPFVSKLNDNVRDITINGISYKWIYADYTLGNTSGKISIDKPSTRLSILDSNYVLTKAGIYWFELEDIAGNKMSYMMILDTTTAKFIVKDQNDGELKSGDVTSLNISAEWGSHKAINLGKSANITSTLCQILGENFEGKYYSGANSNLEKFKSTMYDTSEDELTFLVENQKVIIKSRGLNYEIYADGSYQGQDKKITVINGHKVRIEVDTNEKSYSLLLFGENQVDTNDSKSYFTITLNSDKSEGTIMSASSESALYNKVYVTNDIYKYSEGQATNDRLLVFDWLSGEGTNYEVGEIYYEYYPLMTQETLNIYEGNSNDYKYYPYEYHETTEASKNYIYGGPSNAKLYYSINKDGKNYYRSQTINAGYVLYYDDNGNLASNTATLPGMYVITRVYKNEIETTDTEKDVKTKNYVFFVDRNKIIDYSTTDNSIKTVGEYIDWYLQNYLSFSNFTQEIDTLNYSFDGTTISCNVYLETNRLPLEIRVPTGKYASNSNGEITRTSNSISGGLKLEIWYQDSYNILGYNTTDSLSFKLFDMNNANVDYVTEGYISYALSNSSLYPSPYVQDYLSACSKTGDKNISLPGYYFIKIYDNVGSEVSETNVYKIDNPNCITLGIKIKEELPEVSLFANQNPLDNENVEYADFSNNKLIFTTSKAYIRYLLPNIDNESYNAQIDTSYIYVLQDDKPYNINDQSTFNYNGHNINYIQNTDDGVIVWLDTGLEIQDNKIINYKEYNYKIKVRYELGDKNGYQNYYVYNTHEGQKQYYETTVSVNIDRTAFINNLENIVGANGDYLSQESFLEEYIKNYNSDNISLDGKLDSKIYNTNGYRGIDGTDNYAVVNKLYYYYVDNGDIEKAKNSIYAIRVNENTEFISQTESEKNNEVYYRKLTNNLMALLPVCDTYFGNSSNYDVFSKSQFTSAQNISNNPTWGNILSEKGYYEIIEIDESGNYTQYVVLYIEDNNTEASYNPSIRFTDLTEQPYLINFNFATYENGKILFKPELNVSYNSEIITSGFMLYIFQTVSDMFGKTTNNMLITSDNPENNTLNDDFYKFNFIVGTAGDIKENIEFYSNSVNNDLSKIIAEQLVKYHESNYTLTIKNRFGQSLSVSFLNSEDPDKYSLNTSEFVAKKDGENYYIDLEDLTTTNTSEGGLKISYYATKVILTDLTDGTIKTCIRISDEVWEINDKEQSSKVYLETNHAYLAEIIDLNQKEYEKYLYAYENPSDDKINCYGDYETISNIYYTSNIVDISYNYIIYNGQKIKISLDGALIYNDTITNSELSEEDNNLTVSIYDNVYIKITKKDNYYWVRFYPYNYNIGKAGASGGLIEIEYSLIYDSTVKKTYNIVIDNRFGGLTFVANDSDRSSNLIVSYDSISETNLDRDISYDYKSLYKLAPITTLSEEVYLNWQDFLDVRYVNSYSVKYFNLKLRLFEFVSKDEMKEIDISDKNYIYIAPKVDSFGRYVFVAELNNSKGKIIVYKAFSFNVSKTANAMYIVQDSDGNKIDYSDFVYGRDLVGSEGLFTFESVKNVFEFASVDDENYTTFCNQKIPVYVSNKVLTVVRNGENEENSVYMVISEDEYKLYLYRVYKRGIFSTYLAILQVNELTELIRPTDDIRYSSDSATSLTDKTSLFAKQFGNLIFPSYYIGNVTSEAGKKLIKINKLYVEVYYTYSTDDMAVKVGDFYGNVNNETSSIKLSTAGRYLIYLKDIAGNVRVWGHSATGEEIKYFTLTVIPEAIVMVNGEAPVNYAYYNESVTVAVAFKNYSNFYDNASVKMYAYRNGSSQNYITTSGGRKTEYISEFTFTEYGTYRVVICAKSNGNDINKEIVFSIINPNEARMALDFTAISKHEILSVVNITTNTDVTDIFNFLINEGFIYSKLITYERLTAENAFGVNMGKQMFEVSYKVQDDLMIPPRVISFKFSINNETPTIQSSLTPGKSTTKNITLKFNPQAIFRQAGDCYIVINDQIVMSINENDALDTTKMIKLTEASTYYVKIVTDSGRVLSSFKVTIKEPLNVWSILLIVGGILLVVGIVVTFIILRTKMKVR